MQKQAKAMLIRDPIHGDIEIGKLEAAVLDLPAVQRLRGIKQLGTAHLVYPGAVHTRFDHSLGACAAAHRIVSTLRDAGESISAGVEELIGAAALLHDVTHVPYGHTLEDERRLFPRHDKGTRLERLLKAELGDALERLGTRAELTDLLGAGFASSAMPRWASEIVSSTIDADLLDYLRRDGYFTGLSHDYDDRVFRYFAIADGRLALRMARHGMERFDARSEVIQLLRMRYFLTERVYYHHTKVVAGAMVSKAVELALDCGELHESDLLTLNDWTLLEHLAHSSNPAVVALSDRLRNRDLLKRGFVVSSQTVGPARRAELIGHYHESRAHRAQAEARLAAELGLPPGELIIYCPAQTAMKEAAALVVTAGGPRRLNDENGAAYAEIRAIEERYADLWRLYVFVPAGAVTRAAKAAASLFGCPTEYAAKDATG
jgi:HD superfamily phosphohydrolase